MRFFFTKLPLTTQVDILSSPNIHQFAFIRSQMTQFKLIGVRRFQMLWVPTITLSGLWAQVKENLTFWNLKVLD